MRTDRDIEYQLVHSHEYDDEPINGRVELSPYMCRACEIATGDPYAWTASA